MSVSDSIAQGVVIQYPATFSSAYVQDGVLLEIGPLASWVPSVWKTIVPEVSRYYPQILGVEAIPVKVTTAERTFWEKVTIAHQIAYSKKQIPPRYARHYYDIVMLSRSGVAATALQDVELLRSVAEFKDRFYPSRAARYDLARPGTVRILPCEERLAELARDYRNMTTMFYGTPPDWQALVDELHHLEQRLNNIDPV